MTDSPQGNMFSPDYKTARRRFLVSAKKSGGQLSQLPSESTSGGDGLVTDIAWLGSRQPERALVVVSGIHGVEGFAGSAIQLAVLEQVIELPKDMALVLVHVLNPYGMANLRRFNANNVDLNRNFHFSKDGWKGAPRGYAALNSFLNPPVPPTFDFFHLKLLMAQFSLGEKAIKQAVAAGQYRYPKGLFYGGNGLEPEAANYIKWLEDSSLLDAKKLMVVDLHTGLGQCGEQLIFLRSKSLSREDLCCRLGIEITPYKKESTVMGYDHGGGSNSIYRRLYHGEELTCLTVEYGTHNGRRLLYALRAENQLHHYGESHLTHWAKQKLREAFSPKSETWRNAVVSQGLSLIRNAIHRA